MALVSCLCSNTLSNVGWYADSGASRPMTYGRSLLNKIKEKEGGMSVELGDNATYSERGVRSISFQMLSGDVLQLDFLFLVPSLRKNLLQFLV